MKSATSRNKRSILMKAFTSYRRKSDPIADSFTGEISTLNLVLSLIKSQQINFVSKTEIKTDSFIQSLSLLQSALKNAYDSQKEEKSIFLEKVNYSK